MLASAAAPEPPAAAAAAALGLLVSRLVVSSDCQRKICRSSGESPCQHMGATAAGSSKARAMYRCCAGAIAGAENSRIHLCPKEGTLTEDDSVPWQLCEGCAVRSSNLHCHI